LDLRRLDRVVARYEVAKVIGQRVELKADGVGGKGTA
jgi:hypothetical protein